MARRTHYGKYIISAGEIGSYTVCPEAWRLKIVEQVEHVQEESVRTGKKLHHEWARNFDEAVYLSRGLRLVLILILVSIILYCVSL